MSTLLPRRSFGLIAAGGLALLAGGGHAGAFVGCLTVRGHYAEHLVTDGCTSPAGVCIAGDYTGAVSGPFSGAATALVPTADTPVTGVLAFTSDSSIEATVAGRAGTLLIKNAGVFRTAAPGDIVDVQTIVGGTGDLAGASGSMRASGTFDAATGGQSDYEGLVCLS